MYLPVVAHRQLSAPHDASRAPPCGGQRALAKLRWVQALRGSDITPESVASIMQQIGQSVAHLHDGGLVHGDLTTSNMLLRHTDDKLVLIDFGLAYNSTNPEDKAVDLYVMERAFTSAHSEREGLFKVVLQAYKDASKQHCPVFNRFAEVRMRGRKRTMVG